MHRPRAWLLVWALAALGAVALAVACASSTPSEPPGGETSRFGNPQPGDPPIIMTSPPAGDAGVDAATIADAACPGHAGPASVWIEGLYCIDSTEVSNAHYREFLGSVDAAPPTFHPACAGKTSFQPGTWPVADASLSLPVVFVDWCDAYAFCKWAGKRLCGAIDGGPAPFNGHADPSQDMWYRACSRGGERGFPYGSTYEAGVCVDPSVGALQPVGSRPSCQGGYPQVFDMSGNASEWEDNCQTLDGSAGSMGTNCYARGGHAQQSPTFLACDSGLVATTRSTRAPLRSFRCCSP